VLLRHYAAAPRHHEIAGLLRDAAHLIEAHADPEAVDAVEAARFLGAGVSASWIRKQVAQKRIPFHQTTQGGSVWFDRNELRVWWEAIRQDPFPEMRR
jgi:excisionase family DNA binding protein